MDAPNVFDKDKEPQFGSFLEKITSRKEPLVEKMYSDMLTLLSNEKNIDMFTFLKDDIEIRRVYKMIIANEIFYKKYVNRYIIDDKGNIKYNIIYGTGKQHRKIISKIPIDNPDYTIYDSLIKSYLKILVSKRGWRSEQIVKMFTGFNPPEQKNILGGIGRGINNMINPNRNTLG